MCGSDPGALTDRPAPAQAIPRLRARERVFCAPLWCHLREGSWPFTLALVAPPVVAFAAFVVAAVTGETRTLWAVVAAVGVAAAEFVTFAGSRPRGLSATVTSCSWLALGEGYLRLGMSFFRPRILLEQIVGVERGRLRRRGWEPCPDGPRMRVRFVMRGTWEVASAAYPVAIDPLGELTAQLQLAAARNQDRLRFALNASDEEITETYRRLEAAYLTSRPHADPARSISPLPAPGQSPPDFASRPEPGYSP